MPSPTDTDRHAQDPQKPGEPQQPGPSALPTDPSTTPDPSYKGGSARHPGDSSVESGGGTQGGEGGA